MFRSPLLVTSLLPLVILALMGCEDDKDTATPPEDTAPTEDTSAQDTAETDPEPVWYDETMETSITFNEVYASGRGIYVTGTEGTLWRYKSSTGWAEVEVEVDDENLNGIWGSGSEDELLYVVVGDAGWVGRYSGGTLTVEDLGTNNFESVDGLSSTELVAVGWGGAYSYDGITWTYEELPSGVRLNDVWVHDDLIVGVGEDGVIVTRSDGTWTSQESPVSESLHGVSGSAANDVWAVGKDGTVVHYDGSDWNEVEESPTSQTLWSVWAASGTAIYAVGNGGEAWRYDGSNWSSLPTGVTNNLYHVHGASETDCWAVGNRGGALHYTGD